MPEKGIPFIFLSRVLCPGNDRPTAVLRSDGVSERALFVIDKKGLIRYMDVHDINKRRRLEVLIEELRKLEEQERG